MRKVKLWKIIWVIASLLYLLPVAVYTLFNMPMEYGVKRMWALNVFGVMEQNDERYYKDRDFHEKMMHAEITTSYDEYISFVKKEYEADPSRKVILEKLYQLDREYQQRLSGLWKQQAISVVIGIGLWIIPVIAVYHEFIKS